MKLKIGLIVAFAIVAMAQLLVPTLMISRQSAIARSGNEFKFKIRQNRMGATIQGNFISFQFEADLFRVADAKEWERNQAVYVTFDKDSLGFARVRNVTKEKPLDSKDWVRAKAFLIIRDSTKNKEARERNLNNLRGRSLFNYIDYSYLKLNYPFSKYHIQDTNTKEWAKAFSAKMRDSLSTVTLSVKIIENEFLSEELKLDSVSFRDFVKGQKQ
jgi:hypothetical protein